MITDNDIFRKIVESSDRFAAVISSDGSILFLNNINLNKNRTDEENPIGRILWEKTEPFTKSGLMKLKSAFIEALKGTEKHDSAEYINGNGEKEWLDFIMTPVNDGQNTITHVLIIEENKKTGTEINKENKNDYHKFNSEKAGTVLNEMLEALFIFDGTMKITDIVVGMKGEMIFNPGQIIGYDLKDIFIEYGLHEKILEAAEKSVYMNEVRSFEYTFNFESVYHYFDIRVKRINTEVTIVSIMDISDKKRDQANLIETQTMESIGALAGGIAHDFNNMLGGIAGYANLLVTMEDDPHKIEYLQLINKAVKKAASLTQDLLAFGKRAKGHVVQIDIGLLLRQVLSIFKYTSGKRINIEFSLEDWLPEFLGDSTQMNQVFLNLLQNAAEAIQDNGTISVNVHKMECQNAIISYTNKRINGTFLMIEISDSGIGIDQHNLTKIFEPFFSTKDQNKIEGRGLGLASVWGIINDHNGHIDVISQKGRGTTFMIYLPV